MAQKLKQLDNPTHISEAVLTNLLFKHSNLGRNERLMVLIWVDRRPQKTRSKRSSKCTAAPTPWKKTSGHKNLGIRFRV